NRPPHSRRAEKVCARAFLGDQTVSTIYGDPLLNPTLSGNQHAKNQTLTGVDDQVNVLVGDVETITDHAKGGNDHLTGGNLTSVGPSSIENILLGDADTMSGSAQGGNDTLIGGNNSG